METKNGIIKTARIFIEDHGMLTAFLVVDFGRGVQEFGGYNLNRCAGQFIRGVLGAAGALSWDELAGRPVRVRGDENKIAAIGHIIEDKWFDPSTMAST